MSLLKKKLIHNLKLNSKTKIAIIGTSICSCVLGDKLKSHFGANVVFYEKTKFIGGAWRSDKYGNIFSNIIAPTNNSEKKVFLKVLNFFRTLKILPKKSELKSFYSNQLVTSYLINFESFFKRFKKKHKIQKLDVRSLKEKSDHVLINNKLKYDYVFFPNYVNIQNIENINSSNKFKLPKKKKIRSKHIRIFCKNKVISDLNNFFYSEKKYGVVDRLQIVKIKNLHKISGRISIEYKNRSKNFLIKNLSQKLRINKIIDATINSYSSIYFNQNEIIKFNMVNKKFNRIRHFDTSSVLGFVKNYFL